MGGERIAVLSHPAGCSFSFIIVIVPLIGQVVNGNGGKDFCETRGKLFMFSPPVENNGFDVQLEHQ